MKPRSSETSCYSRILNCCMFSDMTLRPTSHPVMTRELRLGWARAVRADLGAQSDAWIRRACRIFLSEASAKSGVIDGGQPSFSMPCHRKMVSPRK